VAVLTTRSIVEGGAWIAFVSHDEDDGGWQFHDNAPTPPEPEDAKIVSVRSMVERDASLSQLGDLPEGWQAERDAPGAARRRSAS
jgi:hypothetical protein